MRLDSICLLEKVTCSHGWHTSAGGNRESLVFTIFWYVLTYGIVGHFLIAASAYLGTDPEARMSTLGDLSHERVASMDQDGDGKIEKWEFLRDGLIQGRVCNKEQVDSILKSFDELDVDKSGSLTHEDLGGV